VRSLRAPRPSRPTPGQVAEREARERREMPPKPGRRYSVWGEEALGWALNARPRATRLGRDLGPHAKYDIRRVRDGVRPLAYRLWRSVEDYLARVEREHAAAADLVVPRFRVGLGQGGLQLRRPERKP